MVVAYTAAAIWCDGLVHGSARIAATVWAPSHRAPLEPDFPLLPDFVPLPIAHKRGTLQWVTGAWLELKPKVNSMSCDLCDLHIPEAWMARPDLLLGARPTAGGPSTP